MSVTLRERVDDLRRGDTGRAAQLGVAMIVTNLLALGFTIVFARILGDSGYGDLAAAYRVVALGVEQKQKDIASLGQRKIDDAKAAINPKGTITQRTAAFRAGCMGQG